VGRDAKTWGKPLYLRFAHEMNGNWNSWSPASTTIGREYAAAWKRVHDIFRKEGATNVRWVGRPTSNTTAAPPSPTSTRATLTSTGWGSTATTGARRTRKAWQDSPRSFGSSYNKLAAMTTKPMMIAETASTELGGQKGP
jgi:beta-mannanase